MTTALEGFISWLKDAGLRHNREDWHYGTHIVFVPEQWTATGDAKGDGVLEVMFGSDGGVIHVGIFHEQ